MKKSLQQPGMALLMVLILLSVFSVLALEMTERLQQNMRRVETQKLSQQAYWYAIAAESLAISQLTRSLAHEKEVTLAQGWAKSSGVYPLKEASIRLELSDFQTCFNMNALIDPFSQSKKKKSPRIQLIALLNMLHIPPYEASNMANHIVEFMNKPKPEIEPIDPKVNNSFMLSKPAVSTSGRFLMDESELRVVKGITAQKYRLLKTCICVLPTSSQQLNLNTLKPDKAQVLAALLTPHLSLRQAKQILLARPEKGWRDLNEVFRLPELDGLNVKIQQKLRAYLTLSSDYFMLRAQINMSRGEDFVLNSLLAREGSGPFYVLRHQSGELE